MTIQFKRGVDVSNENEYKFIEMLKDNGFEVQCSISAIFVETSQDDLIGISEVMDQFHEETYIKTNKDCPLN